MNIKEIIKQIIAIPVSISALITRKHNGISYKFAYATVEQFTMSYAYNPDLVKQVRLNLVKLGGAFASKVTQENIDHLVKTMEEAGKHNMAKGTRIISKPGYQIILVKDFLKGFSRQELRATKYHELGHLVNRDLENATGLVIELEKELAADAYAAKHTSKEAMRSVLLKMRENVIERITPIATDEELTAIREEFYGEDSIMTKRLKALS